MAFSIKGIPQMREKLAKIMREQPKVIGKALYQEAQIEMTEAKKRTPVSPTDAMWRAMGRTPPKNVVPGTLRASGLVSPPEYIGTRISVTLSFGGAAVAYAVVQHERLDFFHTTGQAKYLESVLNESRPYMAARVAARIKL